MTMNIMLAVVGYGFAWYLGALVLTLLIVRSGFVLIRERRWASWQNVSRGNHFRPGA